MILGTHELPFTRLLDEMERLKQSGLVDDEIIVQNGNTRYSSEHMKLIPFMSYDEMERLFEQARLIITHAGTGSVTTGLKKGKKVIAAARLQKYGEHNDDHQLELVDVFEKQGHILSWSEGESLEDVIEQAEHFEPKPFHSGKDRMLKILHDFIEEN
ncbi:PssE/Cps14G family polysaccharide biosynthesis glycosyltransferase [Salinibacillus aidingensis]|uniref:PssE/Cps14G family polysaccharide biosynthesis glycosyltransferase n=1 Tax=Salinibacillus aidingensis TaxID=237684 RepID=UPI0031D688DA